MCLDLVFLCSPAEQIFYINKEFFDAYDGKIKRESIVCKENNEKYRRMFSHKFPICVWIWFYYSLHSVITGYLCSIESSLGITWIYPRRRRRRRRRRVKSLLCVDFTRRRNHREQWLYSPNKFYRIVA